MTNINTFFELQRFMIEAIKNSEYTMLFDDKKFYDGF